MYKGCYCFVPAKYMCLCMKRFTYSNIQYFSQNIIILHVCAVFSKAYVFSSVGFCKAFAAGCFLSGVCFFFGLGVANLLAMQNAMTYCSKAQRGLYKQTNLQFQRGNPHVIVDFFNDKMRAGFYI